MIFDFEITKGSHLDVLLGFFVVFFYHESAIFMGSIYPSTSTVAAHRGVFNSRFVFWWFLWVVKGGSKGRGFPNIP